MIRPVNPPHPPAGKGYVLILLPYLSSSPNSRTGWRKTPTCCPCVCPLQTCSCVVWNRMVSSLWGCCDARDCSLTTSVFMLLLEFVMHWDKTTRRGVLSGWVVKCMFHVGKAQCSDCQIKSQPCRSVLQSLSRLSCLSTSRWYLDQHQIIETHRS